MTLLSICQQVARSIPVAAPTAIVTSTDNTARLLLACAQDEGEALARRPQGGWVSMITEYDFLTVSIGPRTGTVANLGAGGVAVVTALSTTADLAAGTFYVSGSGIRSNTIISSVDSLTQITLNQSAITTGTGVSLTFGKAEYALPSDFERAVDNTFWDRSRFWQMRGPLSPQQWQLYKSSPIGQATIQRRYRFRMAGGTTYLAIDPTPFDNGSALVFEYVSNAWCQSATGTRQTSWLADTDTGVVDEYLLRLGIKYRMLDRLGMAYATAQDEYERQVDKAVAHDGAAGILSVSTGEGFPFLGPWSVQDGDYPSTPT